MSKTLGVLGGMSWESTAVYYRLINQGVAQRLGGLHSARVLVHSVDFAEVAAFQAGGDWDGAARLLGQAGAGLRRAGAQALVLATNTMHKLADTIQTIADLPLLHIADATAAALQTAGVRQALLLGTRFTMEDPRIVADRLRAWSGAPGALGASGPTGPTGPTSPLGPTGASGTPDGLTLQVPDTAGRALMHRVIYDELCRGVVQAGSRQAVQALIAQHQALGAQAVILGCTEIGMLIDDASSPLPVFDTTVLHARAAVDWLLAGDMA